MSGPPPFRYIQALGLLAPAVLTGYSLAWSGIWVPTLLRAPSHILLDQWRTQYNVGAKTMPTSSVLCAGFLGYLAWAAKGQGAHRHVVASYGAAAVGILLFIPYTLLVMFPTNNKLIALHEKVSETRAQYQDGVVAEDGETAHELVDKWGLLNLGRAAILGLSAFVALGTGVMDKCEY